MKSAERVLKTAVIGVVRFCGDEPLQLLDIVERVLDCVLPYFGQLPHRSEEIISCEGVLEDQLSFTSGEFNGNARVLGDLLASVHDFAFAPPAN